MSGTEGVQQGSPMRCPQGNSCERQGRPDFLDREVYRVMPVCLAVAHTLAAGEAGCYHLALSVAAHVALSEMNEKKKMAVTQLASYASGWLVELLLLHVHMQILQHKQKYIKSSFFQHIFVSFSLHFLCKML